MILAPPRVGATRVVAAMLGVVVLSSGCGLTSLRADSDDLLTTKRDGSSSEGAGQLAAVSRPLDPLAPKTYRPVIRDGEVPTPTIVAPAGRFAAAAPVTFPDGVSVTVERVTRRVEQGTGAGFFPGRPQTALHLTLVNGSDQQIDLTQVVVSMTYGSGARRLAAPVYGHPAVADFTGTVAPGGTATATYVFALPPGQAQSAVMTVDFDDRHAAATFTGLEEE